MSTREAAVAGYFYDADANRLRQYVEQLLAAAAPAETMPRALIVPHAGYIYSGSTAAFAYRCLQLAPERIERVLLIGPAHRVYVGGMAIPSVDNFATPLGPVELDRAALAEIETLPGVQLSDEAHLEEHSLEVQLPFLQTVLARFKLIPIVVGGADAQQVAAVIDKLADDSTLVVISSDLSHFHNYDEARRLDGNTCRQILAKATNLTGEEACGARAINGFMVSRAGRAGEISMLHACNSGDTAGKRNRVVGYGAFAVH